MQAVLGLFQLAAACKPKGALPGLYDNIPCKDGSFDITAVSQVGLLVANATRIAIAVAGSLAIIMILVASIYYITATGDPGRTKKAKDILINTVTGLVLIVMAYAVVTFIAGNL